MSRQKVIVSQWVVGGEHTERSNGQYFEVKKRRKGQPRGANMEERKEHVRPFKSHAAGSGMGRHKNVLRHTRFPCVPKHSRPFALELFPEVVVTYLLPPHVDTLLPGRLDAGGDSARAH